MGLLTLVVRVARLRVHGDLTYARAVALTVLFVGVVLAVWWFVTRGQIGARIVQPLILPSPTEVLRSFVPLHVEQGLVRSAFTSWLRVTAGFALAASWHCRSGFTWPPFPPSRLSFARSP